MRLSPLFLTTCAMAAMATGCVPQPGGDTDARSSEPPPPDERQTAAAVLDTLMEKDIAALSAHMHPSLGTRFTAATHVRTQPGDDGTPADVRLFADTIAEEFPKEKTRIWGIEDGSGSPIALTVEQYFDKYVWDHDYRTAPDVRWNRVQDRGNTIDNAAAVYPGTQIVEYHFPGFDPQYGGMDWASLRLVLKQNPETKVWRLIGVIHDHWTP